MDQKKNQRWLILKKLKKKNIEIINYSSLSNKNADKEII